MEFGVGQVGCLPLRLKSTFFESLFGTVLIEFFFKMLILTLGANSALTQNPRYPKFQITK